MVKTLEKVREWVDSSASSEEKSSEWGSRFQTALRICSLLEKDSGSHVVFAASYPPKYIDYETLTLGNGENFNKLVVYQLDEDDEKINEKMVVSERKYREIINNEFHKYDHTKTYEKIRNTKQFKDLGFITDNIKANVDKVGKECRICNSESESIKNYDKQMKSVKKFFCEEIKRNKKSEKDFRSIFDF